MSIADRVLTRYLQAGYTGWDPPDDPPEDPDPSELWDEVKHTFPHGLQALLERPQEERTHSHRGDEISVTHKAEIGLDDDDDVGFTLEVRAYRGEDADEDGMYSYSGTEGEFSFVAGRHYWSGKGDEHSLVRNIKPALHHFLEALKHEFPAIAAKYHIR